MFTLKKYVEWQFVGLAEHHWSDDIVKEFILKSIDLDPDVYTKIIGMMDIFDPTLKAEIQELMIDNAKEQIKLIVEDIEADLEDYEEAEEQRLEGISFDNQRLTE